jgi:hypothetical protein
MKDCGYLSRGDPFYGYLCHDILPQLGFPDVFPDFRVYGILASNHVYLYEDPQRRIRIIGKFFGDISDRSSGTAHRHMLKEFDNLCLLRGIGFTGYPHYVARPLGHNAALNCVLVEEFCHGVPLSEFIFHVIRQKDRGILFEKLTALAYFLATMHNRTAMGDRVDFNRDCAYFERIIDQLRNWGHMEWEEGEAFHRLKERWREKGFMWEDNQVLVHGDVTPTNILFGDGLWVIAIDLERMKQADRVFDVGRVAAEIKHFFMQYAGDGWLAEPFIGHFLWEYASHFPERDSAFAAITRRVPFHMGMTFLRIARNSWIDGPYRRRLLDQARATLE